MKKTILNIRGRDYQTYPIRSGRFELEGFHIFGKSGFSDYIPLGKQYIGLKTAHGRKPLDGVSFRVMNGVLEVESE